jgi:maleate isomerase
MNPRAIEPQDVREWTERTIDDGADAVFFGGNGFRAALAIEPLEASLGRPVLTSNQVLLWHLLRHARDPVTVSGFGRLFSPG